MQYPLKPPGRYMLMPDILALTSLDAVALTDPRAATFIQHRSGLLVQGTTVADIMPHKQWDLDNYPERYSAMALSMRERGQTAPIGVCEDVLTDGGHRVAEALRLGWPGMFAVCDLMMTTDATWDAANPNVSWS